MRHTLRMLLRIVCATFTRGVRRGHYTDLEIQRDCTQLNGSSSKEKSRNTSCVRGRFVKGMNYVKEF